MTAAAAPERTAAVGAGAGAGPGRRARTRSPVDVVRLVVGLALVAVGVVVANTFDSALLGLSDDGATLLRDLPPWVRQVPAVVLATAVLAAVVGPLAWALATTRYRRFVLSLLATAAAGGLSMALGDVVYDLVDPPVRAAFDAPPTDWRLTIVGDTSRPGDPVLAAAVAVLAVSTSWLRLALARRLAAGLVVYGLASSFVVGVPALGLVSDVGIGLSVASGILLGFGRHDLTPDRHEIVEAMRSVGLDAVELRPVETDGARSTSWAGTLDAGQRVAVTALGRDERSADLLVRAHRWLRLRKTADHRPFVSLRRAVEHEALVSLQARAAGVRTPRVLGATPAGLDGMVLITEAVDGRPADRLDGVGDETLAAVWAMVPTLHRNRIAHRDLRLTNVVVDDAGAPWLIGFGAAQLAGDEHQLGMDVAELLASTAALVGPDRAVRLAADTVGEHELARALPWLQPLALTAATRLAIGSNEIADLRTALVDRCRIPPEEPARLQRIDAKTLFLLATIVLSSWFLLPQLADIDNIWAQVRTASIWWALAAVAFSILTYAAATTSLLGAIPHRLRFAPAFLAQLASSFANRVTPARVGGVATNVRYFQKQGVPTAVGVTAVGLNAIAGLIMHIVLTLVFLLLSGGNRNAGGLPIPSPTTVAVGFGIAIAVVAVSLVLRPTREVVVERVVPQLKTGWSSLQQIGRSPAHLVLLFGGSAAITLSYLAAMAASLAAFGSTASLPIVGLLFLTGSAVANAAPTPGGLGAAEAALVAAFGLVEETSIVLPAVFLYRFVTFWLPILPGWLALTYLRRSDRI